MKKLLIITGILFSLLGCSDPAEVIPLPPEVPEVTASSINFDVEYIDPFHGTFYPSTYLATATFAANEGGFNPFAVKVTTPLDNCDFKLNIGNTSINSETNIIESLSGIGSNNTFEVEPNWDYNSMRELTQPGNLSMVFNANIDNELIDSKTISIPYRSVNECVWAYLDQDNEPVNINYMFAGYINENHPDIQKILQQALGYGYINSFKGYQGNVIEVFLEVAAIWNVLQQDGMKYSSITSTGNPADKIRSQYVRFFGETYQNKQANCVDGSVFFASILKKLGLKTFLVIQPGHMYMGVYLASDFSDYTIVESTAVGSLDLSNLYQDDQYVYNWYDFDYYVSTATEDKYFNGEVDLDYVKAEISANHFWEIGNIAYDVNFEPHITELQDANNWEYVYMEVDELRKYIQPIK